MPSQRTGLAAPASTAAMRRALLSTLLATLASAARDVQCPGSNVTCPATSHGCVRVKLGLGWACNMSSGWEGHPYTLCYTGAPQPLSTTQKNVLVIGDSVSNGYFMEADSGHNLPDLVADVAQAQHAPWSPGSGGAGDTQHGLDCLDVYLKLTTGAAVKWDLVTFNWGLHDLGNATSDRELYARQLANITERLVATGSNLLYVLTTPMMPTCCNGGPLVPAGEGAPRPQCAANDTKNFYPCDDVVVDLNNRARAIMAQHNIPTVDVYSTVTGICGAKYVNCSICRKEPCQYHYKPAGYDLIAQPIAAAVRKALGAQALPPLATGRRAAPAGAQRETPKHRNEAVWTRGKVAVLAVDTGTFGHTVSVGGKEWLRSLPPTFYCDGAWADLAPSQPAATISSDSDPALGPYDAVSMAWSARSTVPPPQDGASASAPTALTTEIRYFAGADAFFFNTRFGPSGCGNATVPDSQQAAPFEFWASTLPMSHFPRWDAGASSWLRSAAAGFQTWTGRFANDHASHGVGLDGYHGGQEGGPVVLFDAAGGGPVPPAVVLSPASDFNDAILGVAPEAEAPPKCDAGATSGRCELAHNVDYEGNDILPARRNVTSPEACCAACYTEPACTCFSWLNTPGYENYCALKTSTSGKAAVPGHVSGFRCDLPPAPPAPAAPAGLCGGLHGHLASVPGNKTASFVLCGSAGGIRDALDRWGATLRRLYGTARPANDPVTSLLGSWTDNGGWYDDGNRPNTSQLADVQKKLREIGVATRYLQMDPYWYPDGSASSCAESLTPDPARFGPNDPDLSRARAAVGVPLLLYSSYLCANDTANRANYPGVEFVTTRPFDVGWAHGNLSVPSAATSFAFYDRVMSRFSGTLAGGGWEVDFLDFVDLLFPAHTTRLGATRAWAKGMADAAAKHNISIQYCMCLPANLMASLEFGSVTSARASEDNFPGSDASSGRWKIGYGALMMKPLGLGPFIDVIWTTAHQPGAPQYGGRNRSLVELQAAVATLSTGPVGIGDGPGMTNATLVRHIAAADGTLLQPSEPATPVDAMFLPPGSPWAVPRGEVWAAPSELLSAAGAAALPRWHTVLAVDVVKGYALQAAQLWPRPDGGAVFLATALSRRCKSGEPVSGCAVVVGKDHPLTVSTAPPAGVELGHEIYHLAPVLPSGWAVLGEPGRFVAASPKRVVAVADAAGGPSVSVVGAPGEVVTMLFAKRGASVVEVNVTLGKAGAGVARPPSQQ